MARLLLDRGADPNKPQGQMSDWLKDDEASPGKHATAGETPLMKAVAQGENKDIITISNPQSPATCRQPK